MATVGEHDVFGGRGEDACADGGTFAFVGLVTQDGHFDVGRHFCGFGDMYGVVLAAVVYDDDFALEVVSGEK